MTTKTVPLPIEKGIIRILFQIWAPSDMDGADWQAACNEADHLVMRFARQYSGVSYSPTVESLRRAVWVFGVRGDEFNDMEKMVGQLRNHYSRLGLSVGQVVFTVVFEEGEN